jgi:flagellar basal body-associated protein FliL
MHNSGRSEKISKGRVPIIRHTHHHHHHIIIIIIIVIIVIIVIRASVTGHRLISSVTHKASLIHEHCSASFV